MRILIATLSRNLLGGVEKYLQTIIPELLGRRHSIGLLYEYPSDREQVGIDSGLDLASWCPGELGVDSTLKSIRAFAPDIVYSQGIDNGMLEQTLLDTYPAALYAHSYWGTCVTGCKIHALPRIEPCGRRLGPSCLLLYYPRRCGGLNPRTMWKLYQIQSQRRSRLADYQAVLVASRHMQREYQRHGVSAERLRLIPLPIDENSGGLPSLPRRSLGSRILFVGRLMDVKGGDYLLRAIPLAATKLARPLYLTIAGDGPERGRLENLSRQLGLSVEFTGWTNNNVRNDLMRQTDLLAVPSLWPEPFGMVGVEAGRFGVPAVGFAVGGIPDWLIPGQTGELAPGDPPTVEGLAQALVRALADAQHHQKLSSGAWEFAKQFSLEHHLAQLEQVLSARTSAAQMMPSIV